jgi:hypothetical protein
MAAVTTSKRNFEELLEKSKRISKLAEELIEEVGNQIHVPEFRYRISDSKLPDEVWLKKLISSSSISAEERVFAQRILDNINVRKQRKK